MDSQRFRIDWTTELGALSALEPRSDEVLAHARALASGYNEPANAALLGHTETSSPQDVVEHYQLLRKDGAQAFHLFVDGQLVGDADLRGTREGAAEFAFVIAAPGLQGKGLGTRFALMVLAFAFKQLGLSRVYASIVPSNVASRRALEKLGLAVDESAAARGFADEPGDVTLAVARGDFERRNAIALTQVRISERVA